MNAEIYSLAPGNGSEGADTAGGVMSLSAALAILDAPNSRPRPVLLRACLVVERFGSADDKTRAIVFRMILVAEERAIARALRDRVRGQSFPAAERSGAGYRRFLIGALVGLSLGAGLAVFW